MTSYLPGPWLAFVGPSLSVVADVQWASPAADACWSLVSRAGDHSELLELLEVVAALPGFAIVGPDRLRLAGSITALVGESALSGKDARTWATHTLPPDADVRLVVDGPEEDIPYSPLPLLSGVVSVRELWLTTSPAEVAVHLGEPEPPATPVDPEPVGAASEVVHMPARAIAAERVSSVPAPTATEPEGASDPAPPAGSTQARSEAKLDRMFNPAKPAPPGPEPSSATEHVVPAPEERPTSVLPPTPHVHSSPRYSIPTYARAQPAPVVVQPMMDDILGSVSVESTPAGPRSRTAPLPLVLVFPTGKPCPLDRAVLLGREPGVRGNPAGMTLIKVLPQHTDVSRLHLEIHPKHRGVVVINRSEHGTLVRAPDGQARRLGLGESAVVDAGAVLELSPGYRLTVEAGR
ncbi:hypothetical protein [Actinokineospora fastidiosa]|uniref:FHA domain-containing protein n=1 Tax=Actinokineospora fastidiosa TaxID=1816 RepID=A0A918GQA5_9PSEU|nr:hypothetical protein [Actinokineospora fastidiosa]GGS54295.1 hypothetical protein GCM10010171_56770 [Actinokineospora fastidiosa]